MSAMEWSDVPDVARGHRPRSTATMAPIRPVAGAGAGTTPPPVCDLVDVDPRRRRAVQQWVDRYARSVLEIIAGERPAAQVARWTSTDVHHDLCRRAHLVARAGRRTAQSTASTTCTQGTTGAVRQVPRATIRSIHVSFLADHCVEATVHVRQGNRSRAFAARFDWRRDRWICTALDFC